MFFLDRHERSLPQKSLFLGAISVTMTAVLWMMFPLMDFVPQWFEPYLLNGDIIRRGLVFFCLAVYSLRVTVTILIFLKRKFIWTEAILVTSFMTLVLLVFARGGGANPHWVGQLEVSGMALYIVGSFLNTWSEWQRQKFKSDPANKNSLYTLGLFRFSRNINYFGDVVLFSGLALVTGRLSMLVIPLLMSINFVFIIIPRKEAYLAEKYGPQFSKYSRQTRKFVPIFY